MELGVFIRKTCSEKSTCKYCCISLLLSILSCAFSIIVLCKCFPRIIDIQDKTGFDYIGFIIGVLSLLITIVLGWNIYAVIDFKEQSKQIHDKANNVIESHTMLSEGLDKKFEEFRKEFNKKISEAKESAALLESYKRAVSSMELNPELSFHEFINIIIQSNKIKETKLSELALSMAEYIAGRDDLEKEISESIKKLKNENRKTFFEKTINMINSLSKDASDFEDLRNFVNKMYGEKI